MKNTIRVLGTGGDTPFQYDPAIETEFQKAQTKFEELGKAGFTLFSVDPETKDTTLIDKLFQKHVQVIAVPQVSGG
jgi:hypothetical protein